MMLIIPLRPVPSQIVTVSLANQTCQIAIQQKRPGLFCTLSVNNTVIIAGVLCENLNRIVRSLYLGFIGDLTFIDNQGTEDPNFVGLGDRFSLAYLETSDLDGEG